MQFQGQCYVKAARFCNYSGLELATVHCTAAVRGPVHVWLQMQWPNCYQDAIFHLVPKIEQMHQRSRDCVEK